MSDLIIQYQGQPRKVVDLEFDLYWSPDIMLTEAYWDDTGDKLTDDELDYIQDNYQSSLHFYIIDNHLIVIGE